MHHTLEPTPETTLDRYLDELVSAKDTFAHTTCAERIALLTRMSDDTLAVARDQAEAACQAKGIPLNAETTAEEWLGGPMTILRNLRLLERTLQDIERTGRPQLPDNAVRPREDGQVVVRVFPTDRFDRVMMAGFEADVWMDPAVHAETLASVMGTGYQGERPEGKVALVLGAGNVASIGPMDVLYKMFVENQVCILKMNPVNEVIGPHLEKAFKAAIDANYLRVVYGGAEVGEHLVHHPSVDEIHITGSDKVHDVIVWGSGEDGEARRSAHTPRMTKRITSELGCVTPIIIAPGEWTKKEMAFQTQNVATMLTNNASFNCNAAKLLVTSAGWPQRGAFLTQLREVLASVPTREAYYPGAHERHARFTQAYPDSQSIGARSTQTLPWALATGLDPDAEEMAYTSEAWCSFLAEVPLPQQDAAAFLGAAAAFCNDRVWGTLSCSLIIDPRTAADPRVAPALDRAIADLRYGSVVVNHWPGICYGFVSTPWGAYPEHTLDNIGSGIGVVHNTYMLERTQKTVVRGPFVVSPKPPWFTTHRNAARVAEHLTRFEHKPSVFRVAALVLSALRG